MRFILATEEETQVHHITDLTETGVIDLAHFDRKFREKLLHDHPVLEPYVNAPWTWID
jgi:hypothetical protein